MIDLEPVRETAPPKRDLFDLVLTIACWALVGLFGSMVGFILVEGASL